MSYRISPPPSIKYDFLPYIHLHLENYLQNDHRFHHCHNHEFVWYDPVIMGRHGEVLILISNILRVDNFHGRNSLILMKTITMI